MAWYPLLHSWVKDDHSASHEDFIGSMQAWLTPVIISRFRQDGLYFDDIDECRL
jgi:hypothetical protein